MNIKKLIKGIVPPFIFQGLKTFLPANNTWTGVYYNWKKVKSLTIGYDSDIIIDHVLESTLKVKSGEFAFERDGGLFDKIQYSFPLLSALLWITSMKEGRLNLLDFGGSLGSSYFQNRNLLTHANNIIWNIVEQPKFVEKGKLFIENDILKFHYSIDSACAKEKPTTFLLLGSIQYLEEPYKLLKNICDQDFEYIILDRTPFSNNDKDFISLQTLPPGTYKASYPCWIFNKENLMQVFADKYELVYDFSSNFGKIKISNYIVEHQGVFLKHR